ncbi:hypothetical protein BTO20_01335 [Mycobacterium dioxanotrophicus]|uniref:Uncharacterized protein n=1 Tax=Mycobacterium dioxanotrophicus TaxID=482462 RepID=A0A1Y0BWZ5_9MYCO|nr:hypothetical protein [Mycobacterium dioxanotrophicus]ART67416.1 hypothetical protein BTO20_01335 [Mycobacterium dioxanotrophicus]
MTKLAPSASGIARFGRAAWFFGNAYEAVVGVPQLIAGATHRRPGIIGTGSPAPYYAPITPAAMGGTSVVLHRGWQGGADHRTVVAAGASLAGALGLSTYLIRVSTSRSSKEKSPRRCKRISSPAGIGST